MYRNRKAAPLAFAIFSVYLSTLPVPFLPAEEEEAVVATVLAVQGSEVEDSPFLKRPGGEIVPVTVKNAVPIYEGDLLETAKGDWFVSVKVGYADASVENIESFPHRFGVEKGHMKVEQAIQFFKVHIAGSVKTRGDIDPFGRKTSLIEGGMPGLRIFGSSLREITVLFGAEKTRKSAGPDVYRLPLNPNIPEVLEIKISAVERESKKTVGINEALEKTTGGFLFDLSRASYLKPGNTYIIQAEGNTKKEKTFTGEFILQIISEDDENYIAQKAETLTAGETDPLSKILKIAELYAFEYNMPFEARRLFR